MDGETYAQMDTFIQAAEVWVPEGDVLTLAHGDYGHLDLFSAVSQKISFAHGQGLPGKAWAEARPVVLKQFEGSYFKRAKEAKASGLTAALAIPVFALSELKAVLVVFFGDNDQRVGAAEVWTEDNGGMLVLDDGYFGAAQEFEFVSKHTQFPRGQGLPGAVWAKSLPLLFRDLGSAYRFVRASAAGGAGLTNGLGFPVPGPGTKPYIVTLLSALGTPLARRFEIWDARSARIQAGGSPLLVDGVCEIEGTLPNMTESEGNTFAGSVPIGQVLGSGLPVVISDGSSLPAGYRRFVGLPIYADDGLSHIVAWYV
ncbi:MAG: GAF domain-containing protein [Pseudomonadota bacterium]